jgi:hypothetical protein
VLIVDAFICSLNVIVIDCPIGTFVAPARGVDAVTDGGVSSRTLKLEVKAADIALPAMSFTAVIEIVTPPPLGKLVDGWNSATLVACVYVIAPGIVTPPLAFTVKLLALSVDGSTFSLNVTSITEEVGTPAAPTDGVIPIIVGAVTSGGMIVVDGDDAESAETTPDGPFAETA